MVAADSPEASQAGIEIIRRGGNAIDAAVAVSFALAVARPESTGLGGGGFLIYRQAESGQVTVLDFRETAPAATNRHVYTRLIAADPTGPPPSRYGFEAVGVPGLVAGCRAAHERWGRLPFRDLVQPAVRLADEGFATDASYIAACREAMGAYERYPSLKHTCAYVYETYLRQGRMPAAGELVRQPALGRLIERLAGEGPESFYVGSIAEQIVSAMAAHGGLITRDDLAGYTPKVRQAVRFDYRGYEIISMPPPSSGGVCLAEALNILSTVPFRDVYRSDPGRAMHVYVEALKHAFADRARWLGDEDFVQVPRERLTDPAYARSLARRINPTRTAERDAYGDMSLSPDGGTSHFCVVDAQGNCVVASETVNTEFGSLAAVDELGLILNNQMDDFSAEPGKPNAYGLVQSERNAIEPGKRPLSSMSPTLVVKDGEVRLLLGASGGPRIITAVMAVLVNWIDLRRPLPEAVAASRVHHQWTPDEVILEADPPAGWADGLSDRGHRIGRPRSIGVVQAIEIDGRELIGVSDPRKGGRPAGL